MIHHELTFDETIMKKTSNCYAILHIEIVCICNPWYHGFSPALEKKISQAAHQLRSHKWSEPNSHRRPRKKTMPYLMILLAAPKIQGTKENCNPRSEHLYSTVSHRIVKIKPSTLHIELGKYSCRGTDVSVQEDPQMFKSI